MLYLITMNEPLNEEPVVEGIIVTELEQDLEKARALARMLDSRFSVMGIRFGADTLVGLIPVVGDFLTTIPALYPLYLAHKHDLGTWTKLKMLKNVGVDTAVGAVPVVGDAFDLLYKSNLRNLHILEQAVLKQAERRNLPWTARMRNRMREWWSHEKAFWASNA